MFRVVPPPIIRSEYNCIYSIWYLSDRYCYLPLKRQVAVTVWQIPDAVHTVVFAPDDGWRYHLKHVEQFPDINKLSKLHLVGYIYWNIFAMHGPMKLKFLFLIFHQCSRFILWFSDEFWVRSLFLYFCHSPPNCCTVDLVALIKVFLKCQL